MRLTLLATVALLMIGCGQAPAPSPAPAAGNATPVAPAPHPLDTLTGAEIEAAAKVIRAAPQWPEAGMFSTIVLREPPKSEVLAFTPGGPLLLAPFDRFPRGRPYLDRLEYRRLPDERALFIAHRHQGVDVIDVEAHAPGAPEVTEATSPEGPWTRHSAARWTRK